MIPGLSCAEDAKGWNMMRTKVSPCKGCTRVKNPGDCENKCCSVWRNWFLRQWKQINGFYEKYGKQEEKV